MLRMVPLELLELVLRYLSYPDVILTQNLLGIARLVNPDSWGFASTKKARKYRQLYLRKMSQDKPFEVITASGSFAYVFPLDDYQPSGRDGTWSRIRDVMFHVTSPTFR